MWTYNQAVKPPAPFIDLLIRHPFDLNRKAIIVAKIDTAADISTIPLPLLNQLELPIAKKLIARGYNNVSTTIYAYSAHLEVAKTLFEDTRVIVTPKDYAVLGRDILNHFYIHLNGPDLTFNLSLTPL